MVEPAESSSQVTQQLRFVDETRLDWLVVACSTLVVTCSCAALTAYVIWDAPRIKTIPLVLELWIALGWITGFYVALTAMILRPITRFVLTPRLRRYFDVAHGLQLPIVFGGVGTWAIVKLLGRL